MQLDFYKKQETATKNKLQQIKAIASGLKMANAANQISEILQRIMGATFHLVVVGEFSRGKSTFVNALLGRRILPASKNPTTAIISKIVYGDTPAYQIFYKDHRQDDLAEAAFKKLTAPPEPDESDPDSVQTFSKAQKIISAIDFARISYPLPFCKDKVEVVDTPGTNDLNVGRMEITYGYLNQADAVILLLAAYQPLTASEAQFLKERILGNQIQDIFFVISHKDDLDTPEQEQDVVNFITKHLQEILPAGFDLWNRIFLVNSLGALYFHMQEQGEVLTVKQELKLPDTFGDTGFPDFEFALGKFLADEKGMARLRKYSRDAQTVIQMMQHDVSVNIGIVSHSADEVRQKAVEMEPKFQRAKRQAERILTDMQTAFESAGSDMDYKCHAAAHAILSKAKAAVNNLTKDMSASAMQQAIEREVTVEKKNFMDTTLAEWQDIFRNETKRAQESLRKIWEDIDVEYQRSFNLPAAADDSSTSLVLSSPESRKTFSEQAYNFAGEMFRGTEKEDNIFGMIGCISMGAIAGVVGVVTELFGACFGDGRETWRDKVRSEVIRAYSGQGDRIAVAVKTLYQSKTEELCHNLEENVNARIADMERQLQDILREKEAQEQDAEKKKAGLLYKQEELRRISQEMKRLIL